ncbi:hypothetical protein [Rhizomonospora bruguierae]|uniref:hypothetical protein n=1 Tax=Rhizomonospora bruguierae TaxID=1581705 RepID=UPI001BCC6179|nr:hypothetical protein [Micromonospora sp. NBRC 107566]
MGDITYSSMVCASGTSCTSADAMLRNDGDADIVVRSIELLGVSNAAVGVGQPQLYVPIPELVGSTKTGYPPPVALAANLLPVKGTRMPSKPGHRGRDLQILIPIRPTVAGQYWWHGYRVRYSSSGIEYVVTQPSWVTVCVDQVGVNEGTCTAQRPDDES